MSLDQTHWQSRLAALAIKHGIVGASLAIAKDEVTLTATSGVLNLRTGVRVTPDALFQVGSITKVWVATLLMQLVDEGRLDLDAPIVRYLPNFRIADDAITASVTTRQLLSHSSGIDGDLMIDTGRGDDALEKYVDAMSALTRVIPPGSTMSYCNAGYSLLGHLIATLRGKSWDQVLRERLLQPLGLDSAGTLPEEAILHAAAIGHFVPQNAAPIVAPAWHMPRSTGPAGHLHSTAAGQLAFARLHMAGGVAADGKRLLSEASIAAMRQPQVAVPDRWSLGEHWGLGWILSTWGDQPVLAHDGGTLGQAAMLRVLPKAGLAVCVLTNGGRAPTVFFRELVSEIAQSLAGAGPPAFPQPQPERRVDPRRYVGTYVRVGIHIVIAEADGGLAFTLKFTDDMARLLNNPPPETGALLPHDDEVFLVKLPSKPEPLPMVIFEREGQRLVHFNGRTTPRIA